MLDGVLCADCASAQEQLDRAEATKGPDERELPYGWGKIQGVLLIVGGLGLLGRESSHGFSLIDAALNLVMGVCILRRNKLILPLLIVNIGIIGLLIFGVVAQILSPDEQSALLGFALVVWVLYAFYYYRRRREFTRWL